MISKNPTWPRGGGEARRAEEESDPDPGGGGERPRPRPRPRRWRRGGGGRERDEGALPAKALATHEERPHAGDVDDQVQVGENEDVPREEGQVSSIGDGEGEAMLAMA